MNQEKEIKRRQRRDLYLNTIPESDTKTNMSLKQEQERARNHCWTTPLPKDGTGLLLTDKDLDTLVAQAYKAGADEALQEALELVGEDIKDDKPSETVNKHLATWRQGYNEAKAELREALQAKIESV